MSAGGLDSAAKAPPPWLADAPRGALVEGEATLAAAELVGFDVEAHPTHAHDPTDPEAEALLFTYMTGARYVSALRRDGGWAAVDAAWQTPPPSTAHIHERISPTAGRAPPEPDPTPVPP